MAERRMFAKTIIDSDAFLDMPLSTQALYFHLSMRADDDGFINNPKKLARMLGASDDEFKVLLAKKFIIGFESGVIVIKHWRIHNYIQKDRYKKTNYADEMALLSTNEINVYTMDTKCIQDVDAGKDRLELGNNIPFSFTLKKLTSIDNLSSKYKEELITYINSCDGISYEDFESSCIMKGYKYKNFKMAYDKWNKPKNDTKPEIKAWYDQ